MNKQELIERIEDFPCEASLVTEMIRINKNTLLGWVKQLDEPQKPVVPQIVADYIKYTKDAEWDLQEAMDDVAYEDNKDLRKWFNNNIELFARAWLDGYEVEKEKRYLVKMKGLEIDEAYLKFQLDTKYWYMGIFEEHKHARAKHTKTELEEAGFWEVFNSPLFEVEEVKG